MKSNSSYAPRCLQGLYREGLEVRQPSSFNFSIGKKRKKNSRMFYSSGKGGVSSQKLFVYKLVLNLQSTSKISLPVKVNHISLADSEILTYRHTTHTLTDIILILHLKSLYYLIFVCVPKITHQDTIV